MLHVHSVSSRFSFPRLFINNRNNSTLMGKIKHPERNRVPAEIWQIFALSICRQYTHTQHTHMPLVSQKASTTHKHTQSDTHTGLVELVEWFMSDGFWLARHRVAVDPNTLWALPTRNNATHEHTHTHTHTRPVHPLIHQQTSQVDCPSLFSLRIPSYSSTKPAHHDHVFSQTKNQSICDSQDKRKLSASECQLSFPLLPRVACPTSWKHDQNKVLAGRLPLFFWITRCAVISVNEAWGASPVWFVHVWVLQPN